MSGQRTTWQGLELLEERTLLSADGMFPMADAAKDAPAFTPSLAVDAIAWVESGPRDAAAAVLESRDGASDADDWFGSAVAWEDAAGWVGDEGKGQERHRGVAAVAGDGADGGGSGVTVEPLGGVVRVQGLLEPVGGLVDLKPGDVLTGTGTVSGDVTGEGTIRPGNSPGKQTITGNLTPGEGAVTEIEIWGLGQGTTTGYDWVDVSGVASPNGTLKLIFQPQGGYVPALGQTFDILTWGSRPASAVFDNWLGTASIPGHANWALKPEYLADRLRLTVVQTPTLAPGVDGVLLGGLEKLGQVAGFLDGAGAFAQSIPFIGSDLGSLASQGTAIVGGLRDRLTTVLNTLPSAGQVVSTIEGWDNTSAGGFTLRVNGVLAHYGVASTDPMWWDVNLEWMPTAATQALEDVLGGVFGAAFSGAPPSVTVQASVVLDGSFGNDGGFFVGIDRLGARASVNASNLGGFQFGFSPSSGLPALGVTNGTVAVDVWVTATPDAGVLTGGRITSANLTALASGAMPVGDAFNTTDAGTLHAAFPFGYQLVNFAGFSLGGQYVLHVDTDDLLGGAAPAVTLGVQSTLTLLGQTLSGSFTFKDTGTETILQASNVTFSLGAGADRVLGVQHGSGNLVLLGSGVAGTLTMDLALGPAVPGMTLSLAGLSLAVNTTGGSVPTINGVAVNLPAGPYFRVSGHGMLGLSNPEAGLAGDFVLEPRDADSNPGNGYEEVAVAVANMAFAFSEGAQKVVDVTQGAGVLVFRSGGVSGQMTAQAGVALPGFALSGRHTVALNTASSPYNATVNVNGTSLALSLGGGPYLRVASTGSTVGTTATLQVQGTVLRGHFEFERKTTAGSQTVVTVAASAASVELGPSGGSLVQVSNGSGLFLLTTAGFAGDASASVTLAVPGVTSSGSYRLRINTRSGAVNETVTVGGGPVTVNLPVGPYVRVDATAASLSFLGIQVSGDFSFEQRTSVASQALVTVEASNVAFGFGPGMVSGTNGSAFLVLSAGGLAGAGSVTVAVQAFGSGFNRTFDWSLNTLSTAANHQFNIGATLRQVSLPGGPYFRLDSGATAVGLDVTAGPLTVGMSGRVVLSLADPRGPPVALSRHLSGGVNSVSHATATLNPLGDNNAVRVTTTNLATAAAHNDALFRYVDDPTITGTSATASWDGAAKVLTVRLNATQTTATTVVTAINAAGTPFLASLAVPDNGGAGNTGAGTMTWFVATVGVSGLNATLEAGPVALAVTDGTGAFVLTEAGLAGDVRVGGATLTVPGLPAGNAVSLTARSLRVRFNGTGTDVGNPEAVMVRVNGNAADDVPVQFKGAHQRQYFSVSGGADLSILGGAVTLGGDFVFEKAQVNVDGNPGLEDVLKVGATHLAFGLKAGSLEVLSFVQGAGGFVITPAGVAGTVDVQFGAGIVSMSGTARLEVNTTGAALTAVTVPLPTGDRVLNLSAGATLVVTVTNARLHLGSASFPFPSLKVSTSGGTVVVQSADGATTYVTVDGAGNVTTGLSFSDFAAPGPFEFVSMLRQALVWMDAFSDSDLFDAEIPFTGGKKLGDALAWSQVFADEVYAKMATMELQSRSLALETFNAGTGAAEPRSGTIAGATFKLQLGAEAAVTVTVPGWVGGYSNADNNLDELTTALNLALSTAGLGGRVEARIHRVRDQLPSDADYGQRYRDDVVVLALRELDVAKGTTLAMTEADAAIEALGFADNQQAVLTHRYDTRNFFIELGRILSPTSTPGTYDPARRVYAFDVNLGKSLDNQALFGSPTLPFHWNVDLGPLADAQLSGALSVGATVGFRFTLGLDLRAAEVPRILSTTTVPVPANGRISRDATFQLLINDAVTPISVTLDRARTLGNNSVADLAADLNDVLATIDYTGPLVTSPVKLNQLVVFQKAGNGLALSGLHEPDADGNGVPDAGKDFNGDGNTDSWLDVVNRLVVMTGMTDPFATELGFANETMHLGGDTYVYVSGGTSTARGLFIEDASLAGSVTVTTPTAIGGSVRFGFVELTTSGGVLGTLAQDGMTPAPLTAALTLRNPTTGDGRLYLADLMGGTSSEKLGAMVPTPVFTGSVLARLDNLTVGGLGFHLPMGANPELSAWIPDINDLDYNPGPYDGTNTGIFLTYPDLGSLQDFTSLSFTQVVRALNAIADNLADISAFSFLDEPLPFINMSVNDLLDHAQRLADLFDAVAGNGSAASLQEAIDRLETEIERVFDLDPSVLKVWLDDGGLSGRSGKLLGGVGGVQRASVTINPAGDNNALVFESKVLALATLHNGIEVRYVADPAVTGTNATATWDATARLLTVRVNSGRTTATAVRDAVNGLGVLCPVKAEWGTPDNGALGNTGAGTVTTSGMVAGGGVNGASPARFWLMPGGDNNDMVLELKAAHLATASQWNGSTVRMVGDASVTGTTARVAWDATAKVLTIRINPGKTTASAILAAVNAASTPWNAALAPPDNALGGNTGSGTVVTSALAFSLNYSVAYANSLPFQLSLDDLVALLAGDSNAAVRSFLEAATTLVQVGGSGTLDVSASADITLAFGLDLTNPTTVRPFLYDTTGIELRARILGTNLEIEASLGGVFGIFIQNGSLVLDRDGDAATGPKPNPLDPASDRGAVFRLGLRNNNGDGRHYFDEPILEAGSIDLTLDGGVSARLPVFAPFAGNPLGGTADANGDGYPDNELVLQVADIVRLFQDEEVSTRATGAGKIVRFSGNHNDLNVQSSLYSGYQVVFLNSVAAGSETAGYNALTKTLTVHIDAGDTTALAARDAIKAVTGFAGTTLTADDDGVAATTGNTGMGRLNKVMMAAPDFGALFDNLDLCTVISGNIGKILDGLDELLGKIQDGLNALVFSTELPLIGSGLEGAANFIDDFRNGLLLSLRQEVDAAGGSGLAALENAIKKAFWNTLGPGGLDLLVKADDGTELDASQGFGQLDVTIDCDDGLAASLRLKKSLDLLDTTQNPIDFDIGVPGFGLEVEGNVRVSIGFDLQFGFGYDLDDGFYFDTSAGGDAPELVIDFKAEIPGLKAKGELLFLQLEVMDDAVLPSMFTGYFRVDLKDPGDDGRLTFDEILSGGTQAGDIIDWVLGADARVNLDLIGSFGGDAAFPRVLADFRLDWHADTATGFGSPNIRFENIQLDMGSFLSDFLGPILTKVTDVTKPLEPILDLVQARIPVLSDLAGEDLTLLVLADRFGLLEPSTVQFIRDVLKVIDLLNSLEGLGSGTILIPMGSFSLTPDASGGPGTIQSLGDPGSLSFEALATAIEGGRGLSRGARGAGLEDIARAIENSTGPGASSTYRSQTAAFTRDVGSLSNFKIPVFDNPSEIFNLFTGGSVRLVEWRMPTFNFEFTYTQKIPIYPPLYAQFGGQIGAKIDIGFGYDTYGIQKFIASEDKDFLDILDGFYVIDFDESGNERPELTLSGKIFAGASINLLIAEAGVNGGIEAIFTFDLNDVNDDGKVRVSEIIANAQIDPRCIFDIHGEITLFLEAFLKVDLFFFSIDKTWRLADLVLLEFDITCPEPVLAEKIGTELYLNMGSRAAKRLEIDTTDSAERFVVKHVGGDGTAETVDVQWGNWTQTFEGISKVVVQDAGNGDDYVDMRGVLAPSEFHGGVGNDTVYLSNGAGSEAWGDDGNDLVFASTDSGATGVILHGGSGNDILTPGIKAITIYGDAGNDQIVGTAEADHLYGDDGTGTLADGNDVIDGKDGDDVIRGGKGNDTLEGGAGNDWVRGDAGADVIRGSRGDDVLDGGEGDDKLYGGSGNDLLLGGAGADWMNGHGGTDLLVGDHEPSLTVGGLAVSEANLAGLRAAVAALPTSGITVTGISGATGTARGNDMLIGGGGVDALFGGPGDDAMYGGNFMNQGEASVVEEDGNDFMDGGAGHDLMMGDDSMGREGTRNTGIAVQASVWMDIALGGVANSLRDEGENGFAGVVVRLHRNSDGALVATETTDASGIARFLGLDPNHYYLVFVPPTGLAVVGKNAGGALVADEASDDNDAANVAGTLRTDAFHVGYDETETRVAAGFTGAPRISVTDQVVNEGNAGETHVTFMFTLSQPADAPVEVEYRTFDGTALAAAGDYTAIPNTVLTFAPGETSKSVTVVVRGDLMYEPTEQFELRVVRRELMRSTGPVVVEISDALILGTITNDDVIPSLAIADFQQRPWDVDGNPATPDGVQEGRKAVFVVTLSNPSQFNVTVNWRSDVSPEFLTLSVPGAATPWGLPGADFELATGTLVFEPGVTSKTITVTVYDDALDEVDESFVVDLFEPAYAMIGDGRGWGVIADDDQPVGVFIEPVTPSMSPDATEVIEGNLGSQLVSMRVRLTGVSGKEVVVRYNTAPGTASEYVYSGSGESVDYLAPTIAVKQVPSGSGEEQGTVRFAPGETVKVVQVRVYGDTRAEGESNPDNPAVRMETFFVNLFAADGADIAPTPSPLQSNHVTVRIIDDDAPGGGPDQGPWAVSFAQDLWVVDEPGSGSTTVPVTLRRTPGSSNAVVVFATVGGTATGGADYATVFRQLVVFGPTELARTIPVVIYSDSVVEGTERIHLSLRNPTGGPVRGTPGEAVIEIRDEDVPELYFPYEPGELSFVEGSGGGVTSRDILVNLRDPSTMAAVTAPTGGITVTYRIVGITARAPGDFTTSFQPMTGTLVFAPGESSKTIKVDIVGDTTPELPERFAVALSNPQGATLGAHEEYVMATIVDDDLTEISGRVFHDVNGNGLWDLNESPIANVGVQVTYRSGGTTVVANPPGPMMPPIQTDGTGTYRAMVLLGPVTAAVDGATVKSPYQGPLALLLGSGDYTSSTENENQTVEFQGILGLPAFGAVGYQSSFTFALPSETKENPGRGGTDDTMFGGPGNDTMLAGAGDDFVVGGHWMTATDNNQDVNLSSYGAVVVAKTTGLHLVHDSGPIFEIDLGSLPVGGTISGQVWEDANANGQQDLGELFLGEVVVNLYDCEGNPVDSLVTRTGTYQFGRLAIKADGSDSEYVVEFVLPHGKTFVAPVIAPMWVNSDVLVGGRTNMIVLHSGMTSAVEVDAGIRGSAVAPSASSGGLQFGDAAYGVSEEVAGGKLWLRVLRGDASTARVVVVRTVQGTALPGVNYDAMSAVVSFDVGEQEKLVALGIRDSNTLGVCDTPKTLTLELRDAAGRLYNTASVYIGGPLFGGITDDDRIEGGGDWDMILGDSGAIPAGKKIPNLTIAPLVMTAGGPGKDVILGGDGPDWINAQLGADDITGGSGEDVVEAGMGDDVVRVDLDNDIIHGGHGTDRVVSERDVPWIELVTTGPGTAELRHRQSEGAFPLGTFTLTSIEVARLMGGPLDNTFDLQGWDGTAYLSGAGGRDSLRVLATGDVVLKDASAIEGALFLLLQGYWKDAAAVLSSGSTYHLGSIENIRLAGGAGPNVLDASLYSRPVTFVGGAGDDTMLGGSAADEFWFESNTPMGTDTIRGNGGADTITLRGTIAGSTLDLSLVWGGSQVVNANLSLVLLDEVENATGGNGNDTLVGNSLDNVLSGGPGDDTLDGRAGNEVYAFDTDSPWGHETIIENPADLGFDTLDFSSTTTLSIDANLSVLNVAQVINAHLTLTLQGGGIEGLVGGSLDDVLRGDGLDNVLRGGAGNDLLDGKGGDDWLDGGSGDDDLDGGDGNDRIYEVADTSFALSDQRLVRGTGETDALDEIEEAWLVGGPGNNRFVLTGWTGSGGIVGGSGDDTVAWAADGDFALSDALLWSSVADGPMDLTSVEAVELAGGESSNVMDATAFTGEATLMGGGGDDVIRGGGGNDFVHGGAGNDVLSGGGGHDLIVGGSGVDVLEESWAGSGVAVEFVVSNRRLVTTPDGGVAGVDALAELESVRLVGGLGNDIFDVSAWTAGPVLLVGGPGGADLVRVRLAEPGGPGTAGGTATVTNAGVTFTGGAGGIAFVGMEAALVVGTSRDDVLDASLFAGWAVLDGGTGDDVLVGGPGVNWLFGGSGNDRFVFRMTGAPGDSDLVYGGDGIDQLDFSAFTVGVTVDLSAVGVWQPVAAGQVTLVLGALDVESLVGGSGGDVLVGNVLDNGFTGGLGADTIVGGGGLDTLVEQGDAHFTLTDVQLSRSGDAVDILSGIERAVITGGVGGNVLDASGFSGTTWLLGGMGDDTLRGGGGADVLVGGAGDDLLQGGGGDDAYVFDADDVLGSDVIDEVAGVAGGRDVVRFDETRTVGVTLDLSLTTVQDVVAGRLRLTWTSGSSIEDVVGGEGADVIRGNGLDNVLTGGRGADALMGGGGGNDRVREVRDADMVVWGTLTGATLRMTDALGTEVDSLMGIQWVELTGGSSNNVLDATGFAGNVVLWGGDGDDALYGGAAADQLVGGGGDDMLRGNGGDDLLLGGLGNDRYVFDQSTPQGGDMIFELAGQGFADRLVGVGTSGIDVDLHLQLPQVIGSNLTLWLWMAGTIEFSP